MTNKVRSLVCSLLVRSATTLSFSTTNTIRLASVVNSFALFVLIAFGSEKGFAQIISIDSVWSGEVVLTSEVQIDSGVTLMIEPGSVVNGNGFGIP